LQMTKNTAWEPLIALTQVSTTSLRLAVTQTLPVGAQVVAKLFKALRAHYKPVPTNLSRPLLDQVLYACCLENAPADAAEKALHKLVESAYDLNEIRVTTVAELAESLGALPDPARAALSLRRVLQSVFESSYSFSLEAARKHSLAHGLKTLEHLHGATPFVVHHVASTALGGLGMDYALFDTVADGRPLMRNLLRFLLEQEGFAIASETSTTRCAVRGNTRKAASGPSNIAVLARTTTAAITRAVRSGDRTAADARPNPTP